MVAEGALVSDAFHRVDVTGSVRAGLDAGAAAYAQLVVDEDEAVGRSVSCARRTGWDAGRVVAVVALLRDEDPAPIRFDQLLNPRPEVAERDVVLSSTRNDTRHTSIAFIDIDQHRIPLTCLRLWDRQSGGEHHHR